MRTTKSSKRPSPRTVLPTLVVDAEPASLLAALGRGKALQLLALEVSNWEQKSRSEGSYFYAKIEHPKSTTAASTSGKKTIKKPKPSAASKKKS